MFMHLPGEVCGVNFYLHLLFGQMVQFAFSKYCYCIKNNVVASMIKPVSIVNLFKENFVTATIIYTRDW